MLIQIITILFWVYLVYSLGISKNRSIKSAAYVVLGIMIGGLLWSIIAVHLLVALVSLIAPPISLASSFLVLAQFAGSGVAVVALVFCFSALIALLVVTTRPFFLVTLSTVIVLVTFGVLLFVGDRIIHKRICEQAKVQNITDVRVHDLAKYLTRGSRAISADSTGPIAGGKVGTREYVWDNQENRFKDVGFNKRKWFKEREGHSGC